MTRNAPPIRLGIVTFHFVPNYGAVWQAYALQQYLAARGDVYVVDYRPKHVYDGGRFWLPRSRWHAKANIVIAYQKYLRLRERLVENDPFRRSFNRFIENHLRFGTRSYTSLDQLRKDPPPVDALVCGSDQIWNPSAQYGVDPAYYLDFAHPRQFRIAYAPSFGRSEIESRHYERVGALINKFDWLSVREESGVDLIRKLSGRDDVAVVPDPTLLWDDYTLAERHAELPSRYLFSYVLRSAEGVNTLQQRLSVELRLPIVTPRNLHHARSAADHERLFAPRQWLAGIRDAEAVVTNSYHGTLFSIIFRRPFLSVGIGSGKAALNERARSLLGRLGLERRFLGESDFADAEARLAEPIDWQDVERRVAAWRNQVATFFDEALPSGTPTER